MRKTIFAFLLMSIYNLAGAQSVSVIVDSLTNTHLKLIAREDRSFFDQLLAQRKEEKLYVRLDSIHYDVVLIEESYSLMDSLRTITERYFSYSDTGFIREKSKADTAFLPFQMYSMGDSLSVLANYYSSSTVGMYPYDLLDYYYSLPEILENYSKLKPVQELSYDSDPAWPGLESESQFNSAKKEIEKKLKQKLKKTYQIVTFIDKKSNKTLVSFQLPAKDPKLDLRFVYSSHDW